MSSPDTVGHCGLDLALHGAKLFGSAFASVALESIAEALADQPGDQPGIRLFGLTALRPFVEGPLTDIAASAMNGPPRAVRALLFNKTPSTNWSLTWHQDRVIAVKDRIEVEGFGPWSRKHGALHVAPP